MSPLHLRHLMVPFCISMGVKSPIILDTPHSLQMACGKSDNSGNLTWRCLISILPLRVWQNLLPPKKRQCGMCLTAERCHRMLPYTVREQGTRITRPLRDRYSLNHRRYCCCCCVCHDLRSSCVRVHAIHGIRSNIDVAVGIKVIVRLSILAVDS